ncbi:MAG: hypothetical protein PHD13_03190 [Methanocellales archaeon]|nr:hypothetical protein [Methanocellales archaeon]MDD3291593.1 hypothetical protein [Methanocellales archaeon]MDD5235162.1 hypothetical protein [Methanocellales archaeon]MDD5485376.1 hypothetical protein [Methanocellales archaeon]
MNLADGGFAAHIKSSRAYQKKKLAESLDWSTEGIAGDSENDVEMLEVA